MQAVLKRFILYDMDVFPLEIMHVSRCSDLRRDAAPTATYHTSLSAHVCRAVVSNLLFDLMMQTDKEGGCGPTSMKRQHKQVLVLKVICALTLLKGICDGSFDGGSTAWFRYRDRQLQQNFCRMWKDQNEPLMGWTDLRMSADIWKSPAAEHHKKHPIGCFELSQACG